MPPDPSTDAPNPAPAPAKIRVLFRVALAIASLRAQSKGAINHDQAKLLRAWLLSPNVPAEADVADIAFQLGKDNAVIPADAQIGTFDWAAFLAFIEQILPIILALLGG